MADLFLIPQFQHFLGSIARKDAEYFEKLDIQDDFYHIYRFYKDVYCFIPVSGGNTGISAFFLVVGENKAALIDSGKGGGDIASLIRKITDKKIIALYTHEHYDHTGFAGNLENEYMMNVPKSIDRVNSGFSWEEIKKVTPAYTRDESLFDIPKGMCTSPAKLTSMEDGDVFDLGGRKIIAIHTPGHSPASTSFFDEANGILFLGDTFGQRILCHFNDTVLLKSNFSDYGNSILKLIPYAQKSKYIYFCHSHIADTADKIGKVLQYIAQIKKGEAKYCMVPNPMNPADEKQVRVYHFLYCDFVLPAD